jgi:hypothetical protein
VSQRFDHRIRGEAQTDAEVRCALVRGLVAGCSCMRVPQADVVFAPIALLQQPGDAMRSRRAGVRSLTWALELCLLVAGCAVGPLVSAGEGSSGVRAQRPAPARVAQSAALQACADFLFADGAEGRSSGNVCRVSGATAIFTDRAAFLAALAARQTQNAFDDVAAGASGGLNYVDNGFEYLIYTQFFSDGALYNGPGFVSTERVGDNIVVYFSGNPVTAVGGNFWPSDFFLRPTNGSIDLFLDDGTRETIESSGPDDFRGFITALPVGRLTIDAPDIAKPPDGTSPDRWPTLDNLVIGTGR